MIVCGDCEEVLAGLDGDSVDLIVTDPPYGISFMGKDWDKAVPSVAIWKECLRVLKPGAFAFVMSGPRMDCLSEMGKRLAEAGFEIGFSPIYWAYASGFNKSGNMSKLIDKRACRNQLKDELGRSPTKEEMKEAWEGFREVVGKDHYANRGAGINGSTFYYDESDASERGNITLPATAEAAAFEGAYAGAQFKPALEIVIVAMKPLAHGTYIDQALDNGHGITWLDDGRIPTGDKLGGGELSGSYSINPGWDRPWKHNDQVKQRKIVETQTKVEKAESLGRFPANLLVSDDVLNTGEVIKAAPGGMTKFGGMFGNQGDVKSDAIYNDSGSFSRYFSLDAWWQAKLSQLPESVQRTFPFLICAKAAKKEKNLGCEELPETRRATEYGALPVRKCRTCDTRKKQAGPNGRWPDCEHNNWEWVQQKEQGAKGPTKNAHPTVKPLKLMSYLITLGSRPGDLVVDPFAGTCTTGMAAKTLGRDYLMIELDEQWCQIGRRRIEAVEERLC